MFRERLVRLLINTSYVPLIICILVFFNPLNVVADTKGIYVDDQGKVGINIDDSVSIDEGADLQVNGTVHINGLLRLPPLDTPPANPTDGTMYYDASGQLKIWFNNEWKSLANTGDISPNTNGVHCLLREYWTSISGSSLSNLTGHALYPNNPTGFDYLNDFVGVSWNDSTKSKDFADNYGQRIRGYLTPNVSGAHTFWISGDDNQSLLLSTDENPANAVEIASVHEWTSFEEWNKFSRQKSSQIQLIAGQKYYIEAIMKEGGGGDSISVGWLQPGLAGNKPSQVIPGSVLSPYIR